MLGEGDEEDYVNLLTSYDYSAPISEAGDHNVCLPFVSVML